MKKIILILFSVLLFNQSVLAVTLFQALKGPTYSLYMTILRLTLIPFLSLWYVINIKNGEYQDIFYTIMITNWMMGLVVLTFVTFFLKRVFKISFKKLLVF